MTEAQRTVREQQKDAIRQFLYEHSEPLSMADENLKALAESGIRSRYLHGWQQTYAVGAVENGPPIDRPNSEQKIGRSSICAERLAIVEAEFQRRIIQTMVVVRQQRPDEGTAVNVVSPCGDCREAIAHHNPDCKIIIWINGKHQELRKIPIIFLLPLQYKEKVRPQNGDEIANHRFESQG